MGTLQSSDASSDESTHIIGQEEYAWWTTEQVEGAYERWRRGDGRTNLAALRTAVSAVKAFQGGLRSATDKPAPAGAPRSFAALARRASAAAAVEATTRRLSANAAAGVDGGEATAATEGAAGEAADSDGSDGHDGAGRAASATPVSDAGKDDAAAPEDGPAAAAADAGEDTAPAPTESDDSAERRGSLELPPYLISRAGFQIIFTDYGVIRQNEYLALPLELFAGESRAALRVVEARAARGVRVDKRAHTASHAPLCGRQPAVFADGDDMADVRQILAMLTLFSQGAQVKQLELIFRVFDADDSRTMDKEELFAFLSSLASAAYKCGMVKVRATAKEIQGVTDDAFKLADEDASGEIDVEEFIQWAREHVVSRRLIESFKHIRRKLRHKVDHRVMWRTDGRQVEVRGVKTLEGMNEAQRDQRRVLDLLRSESGRPFGTRDLRALRIAFDAECNRAGTLTVGPFKDILVDKHPRLVGQDEIMERLFKSMDADNSGDLDPKEFTLGMLKFVDGNMRDKVKLMFETLDKDGNGDVGASELMELIQDNAEEAAEVAAMTEQVVTSLDKDGDGTISKTELVDGLKKQPVLWEAFAKGMPSLGYSKAQLAESGLDRQFTLPRLKEIFDEENAKREAFDAPELAYNLTQFRLLMQTHFDISRDLMPVINRVFAILDRDHDGVLTAAEVFTGLAQVVNGSTEDRAAFYFAIYDRDGGGELDKDEILSMVLMCQEGVNESASKTNELLRKLDSDGDGSVTLDEFTAAVSKDPSLLETFATMFNVEVEPMEEEEKETVEERRTRVLSAMVENDHRRERVDEEVRRGLRQPDRPAFMSLKSDDAPPSPTAADSSSGSPSGAAGGVLSPIDKLRGAATTVVKSRRALMSWTGKDEVLDNPVPQEPGKRLMPIGVRTLRRASANTIQLVRDKLLAEQPHDSDPSGVARDKRAALRTVQRELGRKMKETITQQQERVRGGVRKQLRIERTLPSSLRKLGRLMKGKEPAEGLSATMDSPPGSERPPRTQRLLSSSSMPELGGARPESPPGSAATHSRGLRATGGSWMGVPVFADGKLLKLPDVPGTVPTSDPAASSTDTPGRAGSPLRSTGRKVPPPVANAVRAGGAYSGTINHELTMRRVELIRSGTASPKVNWVSEKDVAAAVRKAAQRASSHALVDDRSSVSSFPEVHPVQGKEPEEAQARRDAFFERHPDRGRRASRVEGADLQLAQSGVAEMPPVSTSTVKRRAPQTVERFRDRGNVYERLRASTRPSAKRSSPSRAPHTPLANTGHSEPSPAFEAGLHAAGELERAASLGSLPRIHTPQRDGDRSILSKLPVSSLSRDTKAVAAAFMAQQAASAPRLKLGNAGEQFNPVVRRSRVQNVPLASSPLWDARAGQPATRSRAAPRRQWG